MWIQSTTIPRFMIDVQQARILSTPSGFDEPIFLKINMEIPHPDNNVHVEFWYSTLLDVPNVLLEDMYVYH